MVGVGGDGVYKWAAVLAVAICALRAEAQTVPPPPTTTPQYDALFKRMFADPGNVEITFRFAALATRIGDYEAAIAALERILYFNPNLARVKLELGELYFKLGAYEMARSYFDQVRKSPAAGVAAEADKFVTELDKRQSPHHWSLFAQAGLRYQSNADFGPSGSNVRSLGQNALLNSRFTKRPDWNAFQQIGVNYSYDLKHGNEDAIEASFFGYDAQQFTLHQFDFGLFEAQTGPRFSLPMNGVSAKVYAIGTASSLGDNLYFAGGGAGTSVRWIVGSGMLAWAEPAIEYRHRTFYDSTNFPTSDQQTGGLLTLATRAAGNITTGVGWIARAAFDNNSTSKTINDFNSYNAWSIDAGLPISWTLSERQLVITPTFGLARADYAAANPRIDPNAVRKDWEWHAGGLIDVQIYGNYGIRTQVLYTVNNSNLPNFATRDLSISVGPTFQF